MRLGLLSTANINRAILAGAAETDRVEIVAVASRDAGKARAYASEHGIPRAHGSYEDLLADPDVDAVYVSLPNGLHHEWTVHALAAVIEILAIPLYGWLSDKVGRRPVYLFGAIFTGVFAFPFFWLVEASTTGLMVLGVVCALVFGHAAMYGPQASFFSELFGTRVRYSGASLGYQLASVIAGGLSPLIAAGLLQRTGGSWAIALFVAGMAAVTAISVFLAIETAHGEIAESVSGRQR